MALVVQDSTGTVAGANGYITREYFLEYHATYGNAVPAEALANPALIDPAIVKATRHTDLTYERLFPGTRLAWPEQTTAFPRADIFMDDLVTPITGLPRELLQAVCELALKVLQGVPLTVDLTATATGDQLVKRVKEKVGPLEEETEYENGGARQGSSFPVVDALLLPLFGTRPTGNTVYR